MKKMIKGLIRNSGFTVSKRNDAKEIKDQSLVTIFKKYQEYTMQPEATYIGNLKLSEYALQIDGDVYECGVWKGGMIAGITEILGKGRSYFLFDSFEGLPVAQSIDGSNAIDWQLKTDDPSYYDNCSAEEIFAKNAMTLSGVTFKLIKGWFNQTLPSFNLEKPIALLRLDGDWYESTLDCLTYLYPKVNNNGLIIIDDYYAWDGCSRAVHDYLSSIKSVSRVRQTEEGIAYIIKKD